MLFWTSQMFIGQCIQATNPLHGHLAESGVVATRVTPHIKRLPHDVED
ncbi:hypothetical protein OIU14_05495 [Thalassobacter stenotrophicus]|nr:hypothetical protein [Thalassobacter stenotrophicus]UYP69186.1 hypothetical protein OIU14_05495 [Thalassobacter stenotrophicus]